MTETSLVMLGIRTDKRRVIAIIIAVGDWLLIIADMGDTSRGFAGEVVAIA